MGRAYEVRKASIQKTGDKKAKLYTMYAKEIYQAAKSGGASEEVNDDLKRLIEKAKKDQVPGDIIKRAIDKVKSGASEDYQTLKYEVFGPASSNLIVECLTDNPNRSISSIRKVANKMDVKIADQGSISYMYDTFSYFEVESTTEDEIMEILIESDLDFKDIYKTGDLVCIKASVRDLNNIRKALLTLGEKSIIKQEVKMESSAKVSLEPEALNTFLKLVELLEDEEDVKKVYHNVINA